MEKFYRLLMILFHSREAKWTTWTDAPGQGLHFGFGPEDSKSPMYSTHVNEDGFTLWVYYTRGDAYLLSLSLKTARQLALNILFRWWIKANWFGLRPMIWFWALRKHNKACKVEFSKWVGKNGQPYGGG